MFLRAILNRSKSKTSSAFDKDCFGYVLKSGALRLMRN